jgi:ADP-ribosylglycohydrolase
LDVSDLGNRLLRWFDSGYLAVDGVVFDVGIQTQEALGALRDGVPAEQAGPSRETANGNGSLMRVLPLALWHRGSDAELVADAARQSLVTHGHARSQVCCALYCLWVRYALHELDDPWTEATQRLRVLAATEPEWVFELDAHVRPEREPEGNGSGYVVDCLHSARLAAREGSFASVIRKAISLGQDTDTTAAVAGGFAGVRGGVSSIPERWRSALAGRAMVEPLLARLLDRCANAI